MMSLPNDIQKIAVSEDLHFRVTFYYSKQKKQFYFNVYNDTTDTGAWFGPVRNGALPMLVHCMQDVISMKGKFTYLD